MGLLIAVPSLLGATTSTTTCTPDRQALGLCNVSGEINGDGVDVSVDGEDSSGSGSGGGGSQGDGWGDDDCVSHEGCRNDFVIVPVTITIDDVRHFPVSPGRALMQPDGWTIAGLHTNFYANAPVQVLSGDLAGTRADVRFTPRQYLWNYGDGDSAALSTAGRTWEAQGIREFARTPTSHIYDRTGDYTIRLSVVFTAEYRYGSGAWAPIVGSLTVPANNLSITAGTADTVLVARHCLEDPTGPGC